MQAHFIKHDIETAAITERLEGLRQGLNRHFELQHEDLGEIAGAMKDLHTAITKQNEITKDMCLFMKNVSQTTEHAAYMEVLKNIVSSRVTETDQLRQIQVALIEVVNQQTHKLNKLAPRPRLVVTHPVQCAPASSAVASTASTV